VNPFGHPTGTEPERFHLIAPYETNSKKWLAVKWIDQYTGEQYRIITADDGANRNTARVKKYADVLAEYEFHPESKCADADGTTCDRQTIGLLRRRRVEIDQITYIGKESNRLEDVEDGMIHSAQDVYTEYTDPRRDEWQTKILPALKKIPLGKLVELSGLSRRALSDLRAGRSRPHPKNEKFLAVVVKEFGC
jgi:hypothetical protein